MQVFELLAQCMNESQERRPDAAEAAQRLQRILERGEFVGGKYVASKTRKLPGNDKVCRCFHLRFVGVPTSAMLVMNAAKRTSVVSTSQLLLF